MDKTVGFLNFDRDRREKTGSARIRTTNLIKYWPESELFVTGRKYDVVIFQKFYWHDYAALYPGIKILDICDPDWLSGLAGVDVVKFLQYVDGVVANTEATAAYMRLLTDKPVVVIPDRHDMALMKQEKIHKGQAKSVFWFGYSHNAGVLKKYIPKLQEYDLDLTLITNEFKSVSSYTHTDFKNKEYYVPWPSTIEKVNLEFIRHDFALLPASRKPQDQYKSNNKATHCWSLGIPVAFWGDDIDRLVKAEERNKEKELMMAKTRRDYDCKLSVREYQTFINELAKIKYGIKN